MRIFTCLAAALLLATPVSAQFRSLLEPSVDYGSPAVVAPITASGVSDAVIETGDVPYLQFNGEYWHHNGLVIGDEGFDPPGDNFYNSIGAVVAGHDPNDPSSPGYGEDTCCWTERGIFAHSAADLDETGEVAYPGEDDTTGGDDGTDDPVDDDSEE